METFTEYYLREKDHIGGILFDADGTLSVAGKPIPGAETCLNLLKKDRFPFLVLTNDACHSLKEKAVLQQKAGLPLTEKDIFSSGNVLKTWVEQNHPQGTFFLCGRMGEPPFPDEAGLKYTSDPAQIDSCSGVLIGEGRFDWQTSIEAVFNFLLAHPTYPCVVPNPDSYWASTPSEKVVGVGSGGIARFICALLHDAGIEYKPVYLGKPYPLIFESACKKLNILAGKDIPRNRILMIGDSLSSDIMGGNMNGLCTGLVLTGITSLKMAEEVSPEKRPIKIFSSI